MKIIHRYLLQSLIRHIGLALGVFVFLFLLFDVFDRIDNVLAERASIWTTVLYFICKIPLMVSLMLPIATMVGVLLTIGLLSKSSEITAMRASGITVYSIATPIIGVGIAMSLLNVTLNETLVPFAQRRSKEIYNIDIRQKDKRGGYSQTDLWWRTGDTMYSIGNFDSRTNTLHELSIVELSKEFGITRRTDAQSAQWVNPILGWTMKNVTEYRMGDDNIASKTSLKSLPLPIKDTPEDFYNAETDPYTMSFAQLRNFISKQARNGISITGYLPYLYEKLAFPLVNLMVALVVFPFALRPARSGSMAGSVLAALVIGFSYYAIHSFSVAMGKAEILPAFLSAWSANLIMGFIALILLAGAESPT